MYANKFAKHTVSDRAEYGSLASVCCRLPSSISALCAKFHEYKSEGQAKNASGTQYDLFASTKYRY